MDDHTVYGETIYKISFGQAIERDLITDYKVVVICITDAEVRELVKKGSRVITTDNQEWDAEALAKRLALAKALDAYGFKKIFTFHGKVSGAKAFTNTESSYSIKQVIEMVGAKKHKQDEIKFFHVNGTMSSGVRNSHLDEFKEAQIGIMSNARCLTEGVDIPAVDAIAFIDPKKSLIDIVQATGRAMRKSEGKDKGYIFVPVVVGEDDDPEECLERSDFKTVWKILQAMVEQDQHLEDEVSKLRVLQGKGEVGSKEWKAAMDEYSKKLEIFNIPNKINAARFTETIYTKAIDVNAKSWDFWYGLTLKYKQEFGNANALGRYKTRNGFKLGMWQQNQRTHHNNENLDKDRIKRLEDIGFIWDQLEEAWENGFQETIRYKQEFGKANVSQRYKTPEGFKLGNWQRSKKHYYNKGKLDNEKIKKLEDIGFIWDQLEGTWETGYEETLRYKQEFGDINAPLEYITPCGFNLGQWQGTQRRTFNSGTLEKVRIKKLADIGFVWDVLGEAWEIGCQETIKYKQFFEKPNAPRSYKTPEGFNLGMWQLSKRNMYRNGALDKTRIKRLEDIEFIWDKFDEAFEKGYQGTIKHKQEFGNANALGRYKTRNGFKLGVWQQNQRTHYNKGRLNNERINKLEKIGFIWDRLEGAWENGYQETVKYKRKFGKANVPDMYKTPDGFNLSNWQYTQRSSYNNGKLDTERITKLEKIGFIWDQLEEVWEKGYQETLKYKQEFGKSNAPNRYKTPDGYKLGVWQLSKRNMYRNGALDKTRIKKLEEIGFIWDQLEDLWKNGYQETIKYKKAFGNPNAPSTYKTTDEFKLGSWQSVQMKAYNKGNLDKERITKLEKIGLIWNKIDEAWERGYQETLKYKRKFGDANVPQSYKTPEGFNLGGWQSERRKSYKKGKFEKDKIRKLEKIGFVWDMRKP